MIGFLLDANHKKLKRSRKKALETLSKSEEERNELYLFISYNLDQLFEIIERIISEVKNIKDKYPRNWKEIVVMMIFSTL